MFFSGPLDLDPTVTNCPGVNIGGRPPGGTSGAAAPCEPPRSSPELYDFSIPCTKTQAEDTGRWRRSSRTHLGRFYGRRRPEGRRLRAAAVVFSGEIQISRRLRLGLRKSARLRKRDRGVSLGHYRGAQSTKSRKKRGCCLLRREEPPSPARPRRAEKKEARWGRADSWA